MSGTSITIGILTGGGDCPGLNAVIRAVTRRALAAGAKVVGIEDGFLGLIEGRTRALTAADVSGILAQGGTILGASNRANPARFARGTNPDGSPRFTDETDRAVETARRAGLDAIVAVGGDGTMEVSSAFLRRAKGLRIVGVPKTIDNDILGTDVTFGFTTAVTTATEALDRVRTTAASHHRTMVVEVMGRYAGWIALHAGVAGGAEVILVPEIPYDPAIIARVVHARANDGKRHTIVCVAEGARPRGGAATVARVDPTSPDPTRLGGIGRVLADQIELATNVESRSIVLGHVQRGGPPVPFDRILGTRLGVHAVELLLRGADARMAAIRGAAVTDVDLSVAASGQRLIGADDELVRAARLTGVCFGD
ncbi:MAG: ATP-dependent 6-phosphofructokinase [Phycisphaerae bacterium]|nr:ATP-dependent 6-phosphofructokinase [Phycisphaerae bacterium]